MKSLWDFSAAFAWLYSEQPFSGERYSHLKIFWNSATCLASWSLLFSPVSKDPDLVSWSHRHHWEEVSEADTNSEGQGWGWRWIGKSHFSEEPATIVSIWQMWFQEIKYSEFWCELSWFGNLNNCFCWFSSASSLDSVVSLTCDTSMCIWHLPKTNFHEPCACTFVLVDESVHTLGHLLTVCLC